VRLSSLLLALVGAALVICVLLLVLGVHFHGPPSAQGAALYDPAREVTVKGVVGEERDFTCPVSEGELESHLMLKTDDGIVQLHLAPGRIMRSHQLHFAPGDQITVVGSRVRIFGKDDIIVRNITSGNEEFVFRDQTGKMMLVQY
jgi:translation initiation factor IF-1